MAPVLRIPDLVRDRIVGERDLDKRRLLRLARTSVLPVGSRVATSRRKSAVADAQRRGRYPVGRGLGVAHKKRIGGGQDAEETSSRTRRSRTRRSARVRPRVFTCAAVTAPVMVGSPFRARSAAARRLVVRVSDGAL